MSWLILVVAGLFEIGWAVGLKYTQGFTKLWPSVLTIISIVLSMSLLGIAVRHLPIGTAYAVWVGIGTVGTAIYGMVVLNEPATALRILCLAFIVGGALGLKALTPAPPPSTTPPAQSPAPMP